MGLSSLASFTRQYMAAFNESRFILIAVWGVHYHRVMNPKLLQVGL